MSYVAQLCRTILWPPNSGSSAPRRFGGSAPRLLAGSATRLLAGSISRLLGSVSVCGDYVHFGLGLVQVLEALLDSVTIGSLVLSLHDRTSSPKDRLLRDFYMYLDAFTNFFASFRPFP